METFAYKHLTIYIPGESIPEYDAGSLARTMAHVDALTVFENMEKAAPSFNAGAMMLLPNVLKPASTMLSGALEAFAILDLPFATNGAEHIFRTTYMHEFFGTFVTMLYARSLSVYTIQ